MAIQQITNRSNDDANHREIIVATPTTTHVIQITSGWRMGLYYASVDYAGVLLAAIGDEEISQLISALWKTSDDADALLLAGHTEAEIGIWGTLLCAYTPEQIALLVEGCRQAAVALLETAMADRWDTTHAV